MKSINTGTTVITNELKSYVYMNENLLRLTAVSIISVLAVLQSQSTSVPHGRTVVGVST